MRPLLLKPKGGTTIPLAACLVIATASMLWFGYRATREWQRSTTEAADIRARNLLMVLSSALEREMKDAQARVLLPFNRAVLGTSLPGGLSNRLAEGLTSHSYVESFFVWTIPPSGDATTYVYSRAERPPPWSSIPEIGQHPLLIGHEPAAIDPIVERARAQASTGARFVSFEHTIGQTRYQVLAHLLYSGEAGVRLFGTVGYTVNLDWVRSHYFGDFIHQMRDVIDDPALDIEIADDQGREVAVTKTHLATGAPARAFPLLFADPAVVSRTVPEERVPEWSVRVSVDHDAALAAANRGASRTLTLLAVAGIIAIVALALTVRAARAAADLAMLQSEFVSAVSHEMKTPLSLITLASDTLASGRYDSSKTIRDYGEMLAHEAHQLTRLIDNVLCYARLHDSGTPSATEPIDVLELVEESVNRFRLQFNAHAFDVQLQLPLEVPAVHADRIMLQHALDNVIDNAVKHGEAGRHLSVKVHADGDWVHIQVGDEGQGIPADEIPHIFEKFYRGRGARERGSGLGLAIVQRIVHEHHGRIDVRTEAGKGTTVDIGLPAVLADSAATPA